MIVKIVNGHFFGQESVNVYKETEKSGQLIIERNVASLPIRIIIYKTV